MSKEGSDSYYTSIESSVRRFYNNSHDILNSLSSETTKAASIAWRSAMWSWDLFTIRLPSTNLIGHDRKDSNSSSLLLQAWNHGPSIWSTMNFASRSWKDLTLSMRFPRGISSSQTHAISPRLISPPSSLSGESDLALLEPASISKKEDWNKNEIAYLLAIGLLYKMRELVLIEAMELLQALRFWIERWENPTLSFIESGPMIWFSAAGYNHDTMVGDKITRIQLMLDRSCHTIGTIQKHLIQAKLKPDALAICKQSHENEWYRRFSKIISDIYARMIGNGVSQNMDDKKKIAEQVLSRFHHVMGSSSSFVNLAEIFHGGKSTNINESELALWCIDAVRLVRDQIIDIISWKDCNNTTTLSVSENGFRVLGRCQIPYEKNDKVLPVWATRNTSSHRIGIIDHVSTGDSHLSANLMDEEKKPLDVCVHDIEGYSSRPSESSIHDLEKLSIEISSLLDILVEIHNQQSLRISHVTPPSRFSRNWYVVVLGLPLVSYTLYKIAQEQLNSKLIPEILNKVMAFCEEHISDPMRSIYRELFTRRGREDVTDRKARYHAIAILKQMIQSWLVDTYPNISVEEAMDKANQMDISLIEQKKEESIKNILELNNIIRMSMIEMQFIKKELMNALYSIDDLMGSNEINVKLAAMTPAFILFSSIRYVFRYLFYALFKLGRSKEQTYESFRFVILDLERLLMMRDNILLASNENDASIQVLGTQDLGLSILLIHECRQMLHQSRRRFRLHDIKNISEDLLELAGERGLITIRQQIQIINRMTRAYALLHAR